MAIVGKKHSGPVMPPNKEKKLAQVLPVAKAEYKW